jgi:hypothetical protein
MVGVDNKKTPRYQNRGLDQIAILGKLFRAKTAKKTLHTIVYDIPHRESGKENQITERVEKQVRQSK